MNNRIYEQQKLFYVEPPSKITTDDFNESDHPRAENGQFSSKGGGGSGASSSTKALKSASLEPIKVNPKWAYQPDDKTDLNDLRKNPIPFVGEGKDWEIGEHLENNTIQPKYYSDTPIEVSKLETLQPFVLGSGIDNYQRWDNTSRPYVVAYKGHYYLLDGNHRAAIAKLNGEKTINCDISVRVDRDSPIRDSMNRTMLKAMLKSKGR